MAVHDGLPKRRGCSLGVAEASGMSHAAVGRLPHRYASYVGRCLFLDKGQTCRQRKRQLGPWDSTHVAETKENIIFGMAEGRPGAGDLGQTREGESKTAIIIMEGMAAAGTRVAKKAQTFKKKKQ